jgi:Tfp pilus assembly protein PilF
MARRFIVPLILLVIGSSAVAAQSPVTRGRTVPAAATAAAVSTQNEQKLHTAFEQLYNLEFDSARELFRQVVADERESATARAFLASALLYEILARQGELQSQLFVTTNHFLHQERLRPDPELKRDFLEVVEEAQSLSRQRLKKNHRDPDGLFALGLTYATLANYAAGVEGKYFHGLHQGEKAHKYHKKLRQLQPEIHDTGIVLGTHDYVLGSLPPVKRFFLLFVGARGNRQRGLQHLQEAAERGEFLRTYARVLLAVASIREKKLEDARHILERLRADYPRNPLFLFELARFYRQQRHYPQAAQICRELLTELVTRPPSLRVLGPEDALLELGRVQAAAGNLEAALESFRQVGQVTEGKQEVLAWAALEQGRIFDRRHEREKVLSKCEKGNPSGGRLGNHQSGTSLRKKSLPPRSRPLTPR